MNTGPQNALPGPQRLGKYELRQQVGRGGVGEVWKGYDIEANRDVAIKLLHSDLQADPGFLQRFETEGQTLATLRHENIVPIFEVGVTHQQENQTLAYITSEYVTGKTLTTYIHETSHRSIFPPFNDIVYLFTSLGVAIDYAHQQGIVHGDIKPSNILLNARNTSHFFYGEPVLTDIGLPRLLGEEANVCSPLYMSPEQAKGELPGNRSDIYSLGVILYELCTGVPPFRDSSSVAVLMQHINTLPTPPLLINPQLPPALSQVILRALAKEPAMRFPLASLLATAIADACSIYPNPSRPRVAVAEEEAFYGTGTGPYTSILGVPQRTNPTIPATPATATSHMSIGQSSPSLPTIAVREAFFPTTTRPSQTVPTSTTQPTTILSSSSGQQAVVARTMPVTPPTPTIPPAFSLPSITSKQAVPSPAPAQRIVTSRPDVPVPVFQSSPPPVSPALPKRKQSRTREFTIYAVLGILLLLVIVASSVIGNILLSQKNVTGHVFFQDDAYGYADTIHIEMQGLGTLSQGQVYRAWLRTTTSHTLPLGTLSQSDTSAMLFYGGDAQHTNLLSLAQSVFITQEASDASTSTPHGNTVYQGAFDTQALPYLKNILYKIPNFPGNGSIIVGLFETIKSLNDKAGSVVDSIQGTHDLALAKRQVIRILELIDGTQYARSSGDLPRGTQSYVNANVGLLSSPAQPGYIDTLSTQLDKLQAVIGNNAPQMQHIQSVRNAIGDLRTWIQQARACDVQLVQAQNLTTPTLIDAALRLKQLIADAYTGRTIAPNAGPTLSSGSAGAYQAYVESKYLATLDLHSA
jgi:serine/threonine protein kinase